MSATADRNLLLGMLALQMGFVSRDALIGAMQAWTLDRSKPLGNILVEQGALTAVRLSLLEPLVAEHLNLYGGDPQQSLAAVGAAVSLRHELTAINDPDLAQSLAHLPGPSRGGGAVDPTVTVPQTDRTGDRFEVLRPHAQGGLGEVFVARDLELNREIALKEIHAKLAGDTTSRLRFVQEAEITGRLEHPGIVPVYGLGQSADGRPYYAMKFVRGETLKHAIEKFHGTTYVDSDSPASGAKPAARAASRQPAEGLTNHSLEFRQLLSRFVDVCNTMSYAHSRGVLHRDLKPSNIMLGNFGETLIVDWGLAKALGKKELPMAASSEQSDDWITPSPMSGSHETVAGTTLGTPAFMSPEQASGRLDQLGPATDVYGLGATLYCLLTGKPPFAGGYVGETLQMVERGEFPRPRVVQPAVAPALEAICLRAMALSPRDRYASAADLAADVEHWLADEPVSAWQEPAAARLARWARRHRAIVASAAALLLAATISVALGAILVGQEQVRTLQAKAEAKTAANLADAQAETAIVVSDFLIGMFEEPTPYEFFGMPLGNRELDPAARALLDRGSQQLTEGLDDQPLVKAAMLAAIGRAHAGTGSLPKSGLLLEQALAIHRRELDADDSRIAEDLAKLSIVYFMQDRTAEAEEAARENLTICRARFDESHEEVLSAKASLGLILGMTGVHLDEAERLWRDVLEVRRKTLDADDPRLGEAMVGLAGMNLWSTRFNPTEALALFADAVKIFAAHEATREIGLGITSYQSFVVFGRFGNDRAAIAALENALGRFKAVFGEKHAITTYSLHVYAQTLFTTGRRDEARAVLDDLFELYQTQGVPFSQAHTVAATLWIYSTLLSESGEQDKLEQILRRVLARQQELTNYWSRNSVTTLASLNGLLQERDKSQEVQPLIDDFLATTELPDNMQSLHGADHCIAVSGLLESTGRIEDATTIARRYLAELRDSPRTEPVELVSLAITLARLLGAQKQFAEADAVFSEASGRARQIAVGDQANPTPLMALTVSWVDTLLGLGRPSDALRVTRDAIQVGRKIRGRDFKNDTNILVAMRRLGDILARQGKADEAKAQFEALVAALQAATKIDREWKNEMIDYSRAQLEKLSPESAATDGAERDAESSDPPAVP